MENFKITSGKINITDPCYKKGMWCGLFNLKARNGNWEAEARQETWGDWGKRIVQITARHTEAKNVTFKRYTTIGVDSGQAGIFDSSMRTGGKYDNSKTFYGACCQATLSNSQCGVIKGRGFVSSSGLGDGVYDVFISKDKDEIMAVSIVFKNSITRKLLTEFLY